MDSTAVLLDDTALIVTLGQGESENENTRHNSTVEIIDSVEQDDSEDEVFFGTQSDKEASRYKKEKRFQRRQTLGVGEDERRRSFEVSIRKDKNSHNSVPSNVSLYAAENSIAEEDEQEYIEAQEVDVEAESSSLESFQVLSVSLNSQKESSSIQGDLGVAPDSEENIKNCTAEDDQSKQEISFQFGHITTRSNKSYRSNSDDSESALSTEIAEINGSISTELCHNIQTEVLSKHEGNEHKINETMDSSSAGDDSVFEHDSSLHGTTGASESFALGHIILEPEAEPVNASVPSIRITKPSIYQEGNSVALDLESPRERSSLQVESVDFDCTAEEKILFDMYGEDYNEEVDKLDKAERWNLKKKIYDLTDQQIYQMEQRLKKVVEGDRRSSITTEDEWSIKLDRNKFDGNRLESVASTISPFAWSSGTPATITDTSDISGIKQLEDSLTSRGSKISQGTSEEATSDYMARMKAVLDTSAESNNDTMAEECEVISSRFQPCGRVSIIPTSEDETNTTGNDEDFSKDSIDDVRDDYNHAYDNEKEHIEAELLPQPQEHYQHVDFHSPSKPYSTYPTYLQHTYSSIQKCSPQKAYISPQKPLSAAKSPLKPWNPSPKIQQTSPAILRAQMSPGNLGMKSPVAEKPVSPSPSRTKQQSSVYSLYTKEDKENFAIPNQPESGIKKKTTFTTPTSKVPIGKGATPTYRGQSGLTTPTQRLQTGIATPTNIRTPNTYRTPTSAKSKLASLKTKDVVASPIGEYIRNNPAPPLYQNVKARLAEDLESTLVQEESINKGREFAALPGGVYRAANIVEDVEYDHSTKDYNLHQALGQEQVSVKITRHVDRVRVPKSIAEESSAGEPYSNIPSVGGSSRIPTASAIPGYIAGASRVLPPGISWNEEDLVRMTTIDNCKFNTPSTARDKCPVKSLLKKTQRNSGLFDESMMDQSIHQTEVLVKLNSRGGIGAGGRGRGGARGRGSGGKVMRGGRGTGKRGRGK